MYNPWLDTALLGLQSSGVVALRLLALAGGGAAAHAESERMVREKVAAHTAATVTLMTGGSLQQVIADYRTVVEANADRLLDAGRAR